MKACATCGRLYPDDAAFCQVDGTTLVRRSRVPPPIQSEDPFIGKQLGDRYLVFRSVADGAMGRVYEGVDIQLERHVAIKVLHREVAQDNIAVARFQREWEVSRQLQHRHVVDVIDFLPTAQGSHALVMEFLTGEELRELLKREKVLAPERVVRIVSQLALVLDVAHQRQLIHRDLKPENLFLCHTPEGDFVKVLDFGSVKDQRPKAKQLTVMGTTIGSPYYMAPEQVQASPNLDGRADVWAMAAVSYECLTGQVPFPGQNGPAILVNILTQAPKPPSHVAEGQRRLLPASVDHALLRALAKSSSARTATVGALADDLGHALGLSGDHREWVAAPEAELRATIARRMPELLAQALPPAGREAAAIDSFFGEFAALGKEQQEQARAARQASLAPRESNLALDELVDPDSGNFARPRKWLWALLLGIIALGVLLYASLS